MEIYNYQWKVLLLNIYQIQLIQIKINKHQFNSYISDENEQYEFDSHAHIFHILKIYLNQEY